LRGSSFGEDILRMRVNGIWGVQYAESRVPRANPGDAKTANRYICPGGKKLGCGERGGSKNRGKVSDWEDALTYRREVEEHGTKREFLEKTYFWFSSRRPGGGDVWNKTDYAFRLVSNKGRSRGRS